MALVAAVVGFVLVAVLITPFDLGLAARLEVYAAVVGLIPCAAEDCKSFDFEEQLHLIVVVVAVAVGVGEGAVAGNDVVVVVAIGAVLVGRKDLQRHLALILALLRLYLPSIDRCCSQHKEEIYQERLLPHQIQFYYHHQLQHHHQRQPNLSDFDLVLLWVSEVCHVAFPLSLCLFLALFPFSKKEE